MQVEVKCPTNCTQKTCPLSHTCLNCAEYKKKTEFKYKKYKKSKNIKRNKTCKKCILETLDNSWINHCKQYAKIHDISYKKAMSEAKESYTRIEKKQKSRPLSIESKSKISTNETVDEITESTDSSFEDIAEVSIKDVQELSPIINTLELIENTKFKKKKEESEKKDKITRPKISPNTEAYVLKKYEHKCNGPSMKEGLSYCCPLKNRSGDGNLINASLYGKMFQIDHIIERNEMLYDTSLKLDVIDNYQPLCLFCHFQKTQIYNALKYDSSIITKDLGKLWLYLRQNKGRLYGNKL